MKKDEIINHVMVENNYMAEEAIFVGDAGTDLKAANEMGLLFIGRSTEDNKETFKDISYKVTNILDVEDILKGLQKER